MRHVGTRSFGSACVAALMLGVVLSGCGVTTTATGGQEAANIATPTPTHAPTPTPTATLDSANGLIPGCPALLFGDAPSPKYIAVGSLRVSVPQRPPDHDYPSVQIPNSVPNAPYQVPLTTEEATQVGAFRPQHPVNPSLETGYELQICNQSSAPHTLSSLSVTIASFTPSSGPVAVWHICQGGPYNPATKQSTPGCGGGIGEVDMLAATLPSDQAGATAPVTPNTKFNASEPKPPISIGPNQSIALLIAINGLTSQGTYALTFNMSVDGATPAILSPSDGPFLVAPSTTEWTGTACQTPAMQAKIPAASQNAYYVCPPTP